MSNNQQLVIFPFKPHLAHYLFYSLTNEIFYDDDSKFRHIDINLNSIDGKYIRMLLEKVNYPKAKEIKDGYRLTVSIPRYNPNYTQTMVDGRSQKLDLSEEAIELLNEYYEVRFRESLLLFVAGAAYGNNYKRGSIEPAIKKFMEVYDLFSAGYTVDQFIQLWKRRNFPLKKSVYEKKKVGNLIDSPKKPSKTLIDSYIK